MTGEVSNRRYVAGTVATRSYRPRVRVLAQSFLRAHPDGRFVVLTIDGPPAPEPIEGVVWLSCEDLRLNDMFELRLRYSPIELCCALKPILAKYVTETLGAPFFVYFDSDTFVYRSQSEMWAALAESDVVLLPHLCKRHDSSPENCVRELAIRPCGTYNAGCFGIASSSASLDFLTWWIGRVRYDCRQRPDEGVFYDQAWLDLARSLFSCISVFMQPAYNVAYWNLFERPLTAGTDGIRAGGQLLAMFHFSGLDLDTGRFRAFRPALQAEVALGSVVRSLVEEYTHRVNAADQESAAAIPYTYPIFDNGVPSDHVFQVLYGALSAEERSRFGIPSRTGRGSFFEWAVCAPGPSDVSPYFLTVYSLRADLQRAFPDIQGRDGPAFLDWIGRSGVVETGHVMRTASSPRI